MATFLDISLVEQASPIFVAIFVWVALYAIFQATKFPGEDKNLHAIISAMMALFVLFIPQLTDVLLIMTPWFAALFIFAMLMLLGARMLGISEQEIATAATSRGGSAILYFMIALGILIALVALGTTFGQDIGPYLDGESENVTLASNTVTPGSAGSTDTGDFNENLTATLFHPKILGMVVLLVIASFTIRQLSRSY